MSKDGRAMMSATPAAGEIPSVRVLVVDDERDDYQLVSMMLRSVARARYETTWCPNPHRALKHLMEGDFDACVLDYHLGGMLGTHLLRQASAARCPQPIIMLTGRNDAALDSAAFELGAADFIAKDELSGPLLERTIRYALARARDSTEMRHRALHDDLTGLANRTLFAERLEQAVRCARRNQEFSFGLMYLDLDAFKPINDQWGHAAGDALLQAIAERLQVGRREVDTVARLGGDEFALLLPGIDNAESAHRLADKIDAVIQKPVVYDSHTLRVGVSIGVRVANGGQLDASTLLSEADAAMYSAKQRNAGPVIAAPLLDRIGLPVFVERSAAAGRLPATFLRPHPSASGAWQMVREDETLVFHNNLGRDEFSIILRHCLQQLVIWRAVPQAPTSLYISIEIAPERVSSVATAIAAEVADEPEVAGALVLETSDSELRDALGEALFATGIRVVLAQLPCALAS